MVESFSPSIADCNIEGNKHLTRVREFLHDYIPDIVMFQEAPQLAVTRIGDEMGYTTLFRSNAYVERVSDDPNMGLAVLSKIPITSHSVRTYHGDHETVPLYIHGSPNSRRHEILFVDFGDVPLRLATTHYLWAPNGGIGEEQKEYMNPFLLNLKNLSPCVIAGDFNIPRGSQLYTQLTREFTDHIPREVYSTIDPKLHRNPGLNIVVDYVLSLGYQVSNVKIIEGVSDHKAILFSTQKNHE